LGELGDALSRRRETGDSLHDAVLAVLREAMPDAKAVCFEGNNYAQAWVEEAERRGLPNLRTTPAALAELVRPEAKEFLQRTGVFSPAETEARYQVNMERYVKGVEIELEALKGLVSTHVLPAAYRQHALLAGDGGSNRSIESARVSLGTLIDELSERMAELHVVSERAAAAEGLDRKGRILADEALPTMAVVREVSDRIEETVADDLWTLPKYREMLLLI
jgi:glutamine synthetase